MWWVILFMCLLFLSMTKFSLVSTSSAVGVKFNIAHWLSRTIPLYAEGGGPPTTQTTYMKIGKYGAVDEAEEAEEPELQYPGFRLHP